MLKRAAAVLGVGLLVACGGNGSSGAATGSGGGCSYISGGRTVSTNVASSCAGCAVSNPDSGADGNTGTAATAAYSAAGTGNVSIRVTAQSGIVFGAGASPGVIVNFHDSADNPPSGSSVGAT